MDREANAKLDQQIEGYLRLLSGYYLNPAATKTLEYLIRRYKIHVHNVDAAVTCALPYHSTPEFVKLVQLCNLENTSFYWLKGVKETGAAPPRDRLVQRSLRDMAFFSFVADTAATATSQKVSVPLWSPRAQPLEFVRSSPRPGTHRFFFRLMRLPFVAQTTPRQTSLAVGDDDTLDEIACRRSTASARNVLRE